MRSPSRLVASSIGAALLITASVATAQLLKEHGAYAGVDRAVAALNGASDRASMVRAPEQALDAAEGAPSSCPPRPAARPWEEVSGRLDEASRRAQEACASIPR